MKNFISVLLCLIGFSLVNAQGINFVHENWETILSRAKVAKKMVYVDVYTDWCGPCKMMARNYFPTKEAGDFFNANFICIKIDAEKEEGPKIAYKYGVRGYPTNLFINPNDQSLVYQFVGMPASLDEYIGEGKKALQEFKTAKDITYYQKIFSKGKFDNTFLKEYLEKNKTLNIKNEKVADKYFELNKNTMNESDILDFIMEYTISANSNIVEYVYSNPSKFEGFTSYKPVLEMSTYQYLEQASEGKDIKDFKKALALFNDKNHYGQLYSYNVASSFYQTNKQMNELRNLNIEVGDKVNYLTEEAIVAENSEVYNSLYNQVKAQIMNQFPAANIDSFATAYLEEQPTYKSMFSVRIAELLNGISWDVVENFSKDKIMISKAQSWIQKALILISTTEPTKLAPLRDTYAHLFFLDGNKESAIALEEAIIESLSETEEDLTDYNDFLNELKR